MSEINDTFFTIVTCMDGRVQTPLKLFGQKIFKAEFPDTITEAGIVGILAYNPSPGFLKNLKVKLEISLNKHFSKGILVSGHQECAGNPVKDEIQIQDILQSVEVIKDLIEKKEKIIGVFVKKSVSNPSEWEAIEV